MRRAANNTDCQPYLSLFIDVLVRLQAGVLTGVLFILKIVSLSNLCCPWAVTYIAHVYSDYIIISDLHYPSHVYPALHHSAYGPRLKLYDEANSHVDQT